MFPRYRYVSARASTVNESPRIRHRPVALAAAALRVEPAPMADPDLVGGAESMDPQNVVTKLVATPARDSWTAVVSTAALAVPWHSRRTGHGRSSGSKQSENAGLEGSRFSNLKAPD